MIKITKTYTDYKDLERTEDFFFNLTKAEIMDMEFSTTGGLTEYLTIISNANDLPSAFKVFKELLSKSYGVRSADGRRFMKSEELSSEFLQTEAYSMIFMDLTTDDEKMSNFIKGILPNDMANKLDLELKTLS